MPRTAPKPNDRKADLAIIHILHKELALSKDDADALKHSITGVVSSADMDLRQRSRYIGHLRKLKATATPPGRGYADQRRRLEHSVSDWQDYRWGKARALWALLARAAVVREDTDSALMAYVKRQTSLEHWRFLNGYQINTVIESLKRWGTREKVEFDV